MRPLRAFGFLRDGSIGGGSKKAAWPVERRQAATPDALALVRLS